MNTTCVNSLATPTFNTVAQGALYVYNHTGSTTTTGAYLIGSDVAASKVATTTNRPVNAVYQTVRIHLINDSAFLFVDGKLLVSATTQVVQGGDALKFAVSIKNNSTTSQNIDIDRIELWADRT